MRILLVDDHALFRSGLANLLTVWGETIVGSASDGQEALEQARALRPDLILMDVNLPNVSGLEATTMIKAEFPLTRVVMLSASDDPDHVLRARKNGAEGYVLKSEAEGVLHQLLKGEVPEAIDPN